MSQDEQRAGGEPEAAPPPQEAAPPPTSASEPGPSAPAPVASGRRLTRSRDDRVIAGVCGGLGDYLGVDAVLVRIAALVLVFAGGAGILLYLIGWIAMPEAPDVSEAGETAAARPAAGTGPERSGAFVLGFVFVVLGAFFLADEIWPDFLAWRYIWPIALIAIGLAIVLRPRR